jgi:hypothetical protein
MIFLSHFVKQVYLVKSFSDERKTEMDKKMQAEQERHRGIVSDILAEKGIEYRKSMQLQVERDEARHVCHELLSWYASFKTQDLPDVPDLLLKSSFSWPADS